MPPLLGAVDGAELHLVAQRLDGAEGGTRLFAVPRRIHVLAAAQDQPAARIQQRGDALRASARA
jgi:hypothetical protein